MTKVSFITASYNYENYIKETIESVINQDFKDWEMIVVDDGSKDNSISVIEEYCKLDSRIKLYTHENSENKGLAETLKLGISKATGDWIVFLESDDCITPDYLTEKFKIIDSNKNALFIFNDTELIGDKEVCNTYKKYFDKQKNILNKKQYPCSLFKEFKKSRLNLIPTFSIVMLHKNLIKELDFNSPLKPSLDYFLWLQLVHKDCFYYIDKKLSKWRMHKNSYIRKEINIKEVSQFNNFRIKTLYKGLDFILESIYWNIKLFFKKLKNTLKTKNKYNTK